MEETNEPSCCEFYMPWLKSHLPKMARETLATCDRCAMLCPSGVTRNPGPFAANLKCCTYTPFLPNFSLGAILAEIPLEEIRLKTKETHLLLPVGLYPLAERLKLHEEAGPLRFGQIANLVCPFLNEKNQQCGIWKYRPGVCSSYFCKSVSGQQGLDTWMEIENNINFFEKEMVTQVLLQICGDETLELCKAAISIDEPGYERDYFIEQAWLSVSIAPEAFFKEALRLARKTSTINKP